MNTRGFCVELFGEFLKFFGSFLYQRQVEGDTFKADFYCKGVWFIKKVCCFVVFYVNGKGLRSSG